MLGPFLRVVAVILLLTTMSACSKVREEALRLHCGAGIRALVAQMATEFARTHGIRIECDYAGANILLSRIKLTGQGDLYMPEDVRYVQQAEAENLIASSVTACYLIPVILVPAGNPKGIHSVAALARPGLRLGFGDSQACAIGSITEQILRNSRASREDFEPNVVFRSLTVNELGLQIKTGKLDATIVWDAVANAYADEGEIVPISADINVIATVPVAVLRCSEHPDLAREFQQFVTSPQGREIFAQHGYSTEPPK